jgi:hypothetical protein
MATVELLDEQWPKILQFLLGCPEVYVGQGTTCRSFMEGVLWIALAALKVCALVDKGICGGMYHHFARGPDLEHLITDSMAVGYTLRC